jgi:hypothetical protein
MESASKKPDNIMTNKLDSPNAFRIRTAKPAAMVAEIKAIYRRLERSVIA